MDSRSGQIFLGCVADDFTGASDAASFLAAQGLKTLLFNGLPKEKIDTNDCEAIVIALKTRSAPADEAVHDTMRALRWLEDNGTLQFYIKYCSTFDSTPKGNIGPDIDAALEHYNVPYTVLCPSLPVNRRVVENGVLIVDGKPIAEGHMARHPLNPIWNSNIEELMKPQGKYDCMIIGKDLLAKGKEEVLREVRRFGTGRKHFYIIPDYASNEQGMKIAEVFGDNRILTGGSGLLEHLAYKYIQRNNRREASVQKTWTDGKGIVLSGSCSTRTGEQCRAYEMEYPTVPVYPAGILEGEQTTESIWEKVAEKRDQEVLVYSVGATEPESLRYKDQKEALRASQRLEETMAELGKKALDNGFKRIIVAGGETAGSVMLAMGFSGFIIGESVAPGVPVLTPLHHPDIRLVLKSGNFGQKDFFSRSLAMTRAPGKEPLEKCEGRISDACKIAKHLFDRGKTAGSSANMSFLYQNRVYITESGACFGELTEESFAVTDLDGDRLNGKVPSKELPLHLSMYNRKESKVQAVIHIHSTYAVLWSCLSHEGREDDVIPAHTPYLRMKLGKVRLVPFAKPGTEELFSAFQERLDLENGYLLSHHGPIVGGATLREAFYAVEELEESARIAWELEKVRNSQPLRISNQLG